MACQSCRDTGFKPQRPTPAPPAVIAEPGDAALLADADDRSLVTADRLAVIHSLLRRFRAVPGDTAELGVYRGGTTALIARTRPDVPCHAFDTFAGLPAEMVTPLDYHTAGEFAADADDVRAYLAAFPNVVIHAGLFPATTAELPDDARFSFVHLDADLYAVTLAALEYFWPRMNTGGVIVLDDYDWPHCPGVKQACREFFARENVVVRSEAGWQAYVIREG